MSTSRPASNFIASRCSADAPVTTSPGLLNIVAARSSAVSGRNRAAFSFSQSSGSPFRRQTRAAAASTSDFASAMRPSTSLVDRSLPNPAMSTAPPTT